MSTPIAADLLNRLADAGVSPANIIEELSWLNHKGIAIKHDRDVYVRMSRAGRNFAMNRRTKYLLCDYLERVQDVVVTNVEVHNAVNLESIAS